MRYIKEIFNKIKQKNATTSVGASSARPHFEGKTRKITIIIPPILILLIAILITITLTNAANSTTEPQTDQTFTEEGDGYYIWVRAVDHAGNKGPWSEAQRVWIETGVPTITIKTNSNTTWAQTGSVTVALQDSKSGLAEGASVKYGWSESLDTEPSSYADTSLSYTAGTNEEVTFTASASGLTGKYYLWVVPTTLADTAGNTQTATVKSTGQFYFDNEKPKLSATNTVNGTVYSGAWTAGPVTTALTFSDDKSGIDADSLEWKETGTDWTNSNNTSTTSHTGSWSANRSSTGYYRIYDNAGNYEEVSFALNIDSNKPTVTVSASTITMTVGERSDTFASLFTVAANGNNTNVTATYTVNGTSTTGTTKLSSLAVGTHTLKCTASKIGGNSNSATITIIVNSAKPAYTKKTYTTPGTYTWTVPSGVTTVKATVAGAGGGGRRYVNCANK